MESHIASRLRAASKLINISMQGEEQEWNDQSTRKVSSASDEKWEVEAETELGKPNLKGCMEGKAVAFGG